jgi:hypothetical protein
MDTVAMKRNWMRYICAAAIGFGIVAPDSMVLAQIGMSNPRSVAMGGAYTALARGVDAPAWNPANLALKSKKKYDFNLFSIGLGFHNNSFSKKHYDLYNGSYLTEQDKLDILAAIPGEGLRGNFDTEVQAFGMCFGNLALTASALGNSDFMLSKDIVDLMLNGNEIDRVYEIGNSDGESYGISSVALSLGFPFPMPLFKQFTLGVSAKYLRGLVYGKVVEANSTMTTDIDGVHGSGRLVVDHALGGNGMAFDFGAAAMLTSNWTLSVGVANAINSMKWSNETKRFTYAFNADSLSVERIEDTDIDSVYRDSDETVDIEPFSTKLPAQVRVGLARIGKRLTLAVNYEQGLKSGLGVSTTPRVAFGTELRLIGFLPLRGGIATGGSTGLSTSAGFALDFSVFSWDFALASRGGTFSGRGLTFAFGWGFRF